ncbi:MAG: hypothetical protein QOJ64_4433 [Acidobacteriota bacterium]|jgi:hypothetical protein|nr:hypothetical protein [Acidobacteriota bacterium]
MASFFCSEQSRAATENAYGTASVGAFWLLLEYPFGWDYHAVDQSLLSDAVKIHLQSAVKEVPHGRLLFIKRERSRLKRISLFVVRCRERDPYVVKLQLENYEQLLQLDLTAISEKNLPEGATIVQDGLFLVCTHGRRDKCCAKFGYPLFKALASVEGESVWQSTHVGGDRFAANLLCFPDGLFYAHMTSDTASKVISEYRSRRLALGNYRGRACYSYPVQAAEYFVRLETGISGVDELRHLDHARLENESWRVRFLQKSEEIVHAVRVTRFQSEFENHVTCQAADVRRMPQFRLDEYAIVPR